MPDLIRDAPIGQLVRFVTRKRYLKYPEETDNWQCPVAAYNDRGSQTQRVLSIPNPAATLLESKESYKRTGAGFRSDSDHLTTAPTQQDLERATLPSSSSSVSTRVLHAETTREISRIVSRPRIGRTNTSATLTEALNDAVRQETIKLQPSRPLQPERTSDNSLLVTWYTTDDQANPQNWSKKKKGLVVLQIYLYTLAIYIAGAIYTPAVPTVIVKFRVSSTVASLGLSMYVLGYGLGPLLFSPLSEIPVIGRNPPYIITFFLYLMVTIPLALIENYPGFVVLRFFQGFFGSPALATGAASISDMYSLLEMPYFLTGWAGFATAGPALGPLISGFSVPAESWHWTMWEVLWLGGPVFISLLLCLPETSTPTLLLQRARRLRARLGKGSNPERAEKTAQLVAQSEIDQASMTTNQVVRENLLRPFQINILDPAVGFTSVYIGLIYGIFYSFFEVFPLVYGSGLPQPNVTQGYGMNLGEQGLIFLSVAVGVSIAIIFYLYYLHFRANPKLRAQLASGSMAPPEGRLRIGLYASLLAPIFLFMFAWTGFNSPRIHWIVPTIAVVFFLSCIFLVFQVVFIYIALTYPQYSASLFGMNDAVRSSVAAGSIHYSHPLFYNLGIGRGVSLLAGLMVMGVIGIFVLWRYGAWLRSKSKFVAK